MRILYIADGRSPTAIQWMSHFIQQGHEVHLVSTYPCKPINGLASLRILPLPFSGKESITSEGSRQAQRSAGKFIPVRVRTLIRQLIIPLSIPRVAPMLGEMIERIQPEIMHAMRIPYEGMIAAQAKEQITDSTGRHSTSELFLSVWGNDFTLHTRSTPLMAAYTRKSLQVCDALHTDCQRDVRLAIELGFAATKPSIVLPGGGGVDLGVFHPGYEDQKAELSRNHGKSAVYIINPRGYRAYVRNDTFFKAIPMVLAKFPEARFVCPGVAEEGEAQRWVRNFAIGDRVELLPVQNRNQMAELFRQAEIMTSITTHDGTPNSLLEGMASGCFPIAGNIESIREWIRPGENGLLVDPADPNELAEAIASAIMQPEMRKRAREANLDIIRERAEHAKVMQLAEEFYQRVVSNA